MPERAMKLRDQRLSLSQLALGVFLVIWNGLGLALAISAQTGQIAGMDPISENYFSSQPTWFVLLADLGPLAGLAGSVALLLQSRMAVWLFVAQFVILAATNIYEFALGRSLVQLMDAPLGPTLFTFLLLAAQAGYAVWLRKRGKLY